jgi:WD40 repeat protein
MIFASPCVSIWPAANFSAGETETTIHTQRGRTRTPRRDELQRKRCGRVPTFRARFQACSSHGGCVAQPPDFPILLNDPSAASAWHPNKNILATGDKDNARVRIWDMNGASRLWTVNADGTRSLAFDPTGHWLAAGGQEGWVCLLELEGNRILERGSPRRNSGHAVINPRMRACSTGVFSLCLLPCAPACSIAFAGTAGDRILRSSS